MDSEAAPIENSAEFSPSRLAVSPTAPIQPAGGICLPWAGCLHC